MKKKLLLKITNIYYFIYYLAHNCWTIHRIHTHTHTFIFHTAITKRY